MIKKRYIMPLLAVLALASCEEEPFTAEKSVPTYLPFFEMAGSSNVKLECGATSYEDPGVTASIGGEEVEPETSVSGAYFGGTTVSGPDVYTISYSVENEDGIPGSVARTVTVPACNGDLVNSIAGTYTGTIVRNGSSGPQYTDVGPIYIKDLGNGQYQLSDAIGGYYDFGRGYGPGYAATGMTITANNIATNSFTFGDPIEVGAFGGELVMKSFTVDPLTNTIKFTSDWDAGYTFVVTLDQVD